MAEPDPELMADDRPLFRPGKPTGRWGFPLLVGALIAAGGALYPVQDGPAGHEQP